MTGPPAEAAREILRAGWPDLAAAPGLELVPLRGGSRHAPWAVRWGGRPRAVLRPGGGLPEALADAPWVWEALEAAGVPACGPLGQPRPGTGPARLWRWVPGRAGRLGGSQARAEALGRLLARVHAVRSPSGASLVHGDPSPRNVLWHRDPGRTPGLVDWEDARFGEPADDLVTVWASLRGAHRMPGPHRRASAAAWIWVEALAVSYVGAGGARPTREGLLRAAAAHRAAGRAWVALLPIAARREGAAWLAGLERACADAGTMDALTAAWRAAGARAP